MVVLLALLALHPGKSLAREELAEALWPDRPPDWQRKRLRYELSLLKQLLGEGSLVRHGNTSVVLADIVTSDVQEFEQACTAAEKAGVTERGKHLLRAAHLQPADLLPGFYEDTILAARERLRRAQYQVLCQLIGDSERRGEEQSALSWRRTLAKRFPDEESPRAAAASPRTLLSPPLPYHNEFPRAVLPPTAFFGRGEEREALRTWQAAETTAEPLLTITGPAGIGKTRFACEMLREGAVFVGLADLEDSDALFDTICAALRLENKPGQGAEKRLLTHLQSAPALLILDNFEQLAEGGAPKLAWLLQAAPQTRCLVTSRMRLEIAGERELVLAPLPPGESRALFVDRAHRTRADFPEDAEEIDALCALLEGIPLSLELAAARALILSPAQMLEQIADRFAFLTSRRRDVPARQQSLRAAVEWSLHLLPGPLLKQFYRLCVFRGGFTQEGAAAVCDTPQGIVDTLETLRANSLIQATFANDQSARYSLLVTLRDYGLSRIAPADHAQARLRHAHFYQQFVRTRESENHQTPIWLERERENLAAALETLDRTDPEACADMTLALCRPWELTGRGETACFWLKRGLENIAPTDTARRGSLFEKYGAMTTHLEERTESFQQAQEAYRRSGDLPAVARVTHALGSAAYARGQTAEARHLYLECLDLRRSLPHSDTSGLASTLHMLAVVSYRLDTTQDVTPLLQEAEKLLREAGNTLGLAFVVSTYRGYAWERGDLVAARRHAQEAQRLYLQHNRTALAAYMVAWQSLPALVEGDVEEAGCWIAEAARLLTDHENPGNHIFLWHLRGKVLTHQASFDAAFSDLCYALQLYEEMGMGESVSTVLRELANWHLLARGDARRAIQLWAAVEARPSVFTQIALPEGHWQEKYQQQAFFLLRGDVAKERLIGCALPSEAVISLATSL